MKTTQERITETENKLKELKEKLNLETQEIDKPIIIICKELKKEFRIYKWENKPFKYFPMPKKFDWCEYSDFIYLYDNDLIELEIYPVYYFTKNQSKKNIKNGWNLSRLYLGRDSYLVSSYDSLASSSSYGRVCICRKLGDKDEE